MKVEQVMIQRNIERLQRRKERKRKECNELDMYISYLRFRKEQEGVDYVPLRGR